ncbi:type II toxin-antitoxin system RelE/ParE family toxin [Castellaniella defragrans]|uniref:type II toxin-antitoxin system RelE/ParE family toxin n=1 Tax=Castellaniella defragrans TaxID=75697 RepID=UPI0005BB6812|nr:type II toxin-antitoxin system RelE/ParE family toxin [Castellaniella defragrans]
MHENQKKILSTERFDEFEQNLKDKAARARIQARIGRLMLGNPGSHRRLEKGVIELKIDVGPGYRVYYVERSMGTIVILLAGGDKSTQDADIKTAYSMADKLDEIA